MIVAIVVMIIDLIILFTEPPNIILSDKMTLPSQFEKGNYENIFIYNYVEEMIANYGNYIKGRYDESEMSRAEIPFLIRIRFNEKTTQKELVELFKVSEGYTAKLLRKFEDLGYITRREDPSNRRKKNS